MTPRFTCILTSHNYAAYLEQAVRSVFAQTLTDYELIAVDDGSMDGSVALLEGLLANAPCPGKLLTQDCRGQAAALNAALAQAHGQYIALLDSDDYWAPGKLARMADFIDRVPHAAVYQHLVWGAKPEDAAGLAQGDCFGQWKAHGPRLNLATHGSMLQGFVPTSGLVFPRGVLKHIGPIPEKLVVCPDGYLTRTAAFYGPVAAFGETLATWRDHGENAGLRPKFAFHNYWITTVMPALNAFYARQNADLELRYDLTGWKARLAHAAAIRKNGPPPQGERLVLPAEALLRMIVALSNRLPKAWRKRLL